MGEATYESTANEATSEGIADDGETGEIRRDELVRLDEKKEFYHTMRFSDDDRKLYILTS